MPRNAPRLRHALITLGLTTAGLAVTAPPAQAADPAPVTLTISPARQTRAQGANGSLLFTMTSNGARVAGKQVAVYIRPTTSTTWTRKWTPTTNQYGQVRITYAVSRTLYVKAKFAGNDTLARAVSNTATVALYVPPPPSSTLAERVIAEAATHRGKPYQWGAVGPNRFDCSGFTLYVFSRFGKSLPHNSGQQYNSVRKVAKSEKRVGDLIFTYNSGGIYHVAIYAGNGYIWHSPHSGDVVKKSQIWSQSYYVGRVA